MKMDQKMEYQEENMMMLCDFDGFPECVPPELKRAYANKGIKRLFDWQTECLSDKDLYAPNFSNLIYTAPTGGGKTMIAEILAACNVMETNRRAILAFPFVANAKEKLVFLQVGPSGVVVFRAVDRSLPLSEHLEVCRHQAQGIRGRRLSRPAQVLPL